MQHEAYLVDLDGTLYRPLLVKLGMAAELALSGWNAVSILRTFRHAHEELRAIDAAASDAARSLTLSPFERQLSLAASKLGISETVIQKTVHDWMLERPRKWIRFALRNDLLSELNAFKQAGGKLAVVSDYPATVKLQALGSRLSFDTIVSNGEPAGPSRLKPDPEGYLIAAKRLGVPAAKCLVIGDRDDADGEAARRAGMQFRLVK